MNLHHGHSKHKPVSMDDNMYRATRAHRAWFATACTALLFSLSKSILLFSTTPSTPRAWLQIISAAALGYLLADLINGVYHWAIDNYGSADTPFFGEQIESFRAHHEHPLEITKYETPAILCSVSQAAIAVVTPFNLFSGDPDLLAFVGVLAGCLMFGVKIHAWAHLPKKKLPPLVAALQAAGILIRLSEHRRHHRPPFNSAYCTVSGMWNGVLDGSKVFISAEVVIFSLTGVRPRSWSEPISEWAPKTPMDEN